MTPTETQTRIPTGIWKSDPIHSEVGFAVRHVTGTFRGSFVDFDAVLTAGEGEPRLSGAVRVESVQVRDETLNGHLLSPDFFDTERFPRIAFESSALRAGGDGIVVEGDLTLKDTTKAVEARGRISEPLVGLDGKERIGLDLETTVDRAEIGLDWNTPLPQGGMLLGDQVGITVHLELVKED
jgi:polyisoprenoid-binding protein YceI